MSLIRSQSEVIKEFNNFIETWENVTATEERFGDLEGLFAFLMKMRALLESCCECRVGDQKGQLITQCQLLMPTT